ncbi:MAG: glycosyltransferase family 4 protein [Vicinamibacterales bacterium]
MKVLLVNDYATPIGGAELSTLELRDALRARGHDARVFASSARPCAGPSFADYECLGTTSRWRTALQTVNPSAFITLRRVLADFRPDVIHVRMFLTQLSPLILPLLSRTPSLYHVVWYRPICPSGLKMLPDGTACHSRPGAVCYREKCLPLRDWVPLMLQMKLWRRWRSVFNLIVTDSEAVRCRLLAEGIAPVELVWHGVPVQPPRPALSFPPLVTFVGRLVREKGVDVLLQAFARAVENVPDARLRLIGDGPERDRLRNLITALGLVSAVTLQGRLSRADAERLCASAWVQAVPSRWPEPFGRVAIEAMMRGTAVVASNCGGLAEIIEDGHMGFLVPPGDVPALAQGLTRLLGDRDRAERMGRAGRQVALHRFSEETLVNRVMGLYQRICQQGASA